MPLKLRNANKNVEKGKNFKIDFKVMQHEINIKKNLNKLV